MKVYGLLANGINVGIAHTCLKSCCDCHSLSYRAALKGRRKFVKGTSTGDMFCEIIEQTVCKIKGRENNYKKKVATKQQAQQ